MLQRELIQSQKFAAIGQAVTGIQHAIKNMLSALKGGAYLVRNGIGKDDRQEIIAPRSVGVAPGRVRLPALAMRRFPVNIRQESRPLVTACPAQRSCRRPDSNPLIHVP